MFKYLRRAYGSWSSTSRSRWRTVDRAIRLGLTCLEGREVPSAGPALQGLSARALGDYWVVSGQIVDNDPAHVQVAVSGSVSGLATVHANGSFEFITQHSGTGTVTVSATDSQGQQAGPQTLSIGAPTGNQAPYLTMNVSYGSQRTITISGQVYDENPGGLTVNFFGSGVGSTTTLANGTFSLTLAASQLGTVQGIARDFQNLASNNAAVTVATARPVIVGMDYSISGNVMTVTGHVTDECAPGLTVTFGGMSPFAGLTAIVQADGSFTISAAVSSNPEQWAPITAQVTDWWGLTSDPAWVTPG